MKLIIHGLEEVPSHQEPLSRKSITFPTKPQGYDSKLNNAEQRKTPKRARVAVVCRRLEGLELTHPDAVRFGVHTGVERLAAKFRSRAHLWPHCEQIAAQVCGGNGCASLAISDARTRQP